MIEEYYKMSPSERADYISKMKKLNPPVDIKSGAGNYLVPLSKMGPTTEGMTPGAKDYRTGQRAPGIQNHKFYDVMRINHVGYRGKLSMTSQATGASQMLSQTCDSEVIEGAFGGFVEGIWVFRKRGEVYVLLLTEDKIIKP